VKIALGSCDPEAMVRRFHEAHEQEYTFRLPDPVEAVNFHLVAYGLMDKPQLSALPEGDADPGPARRGDRAVDYGAAGIQQTAIYDRAALRPGMVITGPAIIEEKATVTLAPAGSRVSVDAHGGLHLLLEG